MNYDPSQINSAPAPAPEAKPEPVVETAPASEPQVLDPAPNPQAPIEPTPAPEPEKEAPSTRFITDPAEITKAKTRSSEPEKPLTSSDKQDPAEVDEAALQAYIANEKNPLHVRTLAKNHDALKKSSAAEIETLRKEIADLKTKPQTADNKAEIAELQRERQRLQEIQSERDELVKTLRRTDVEQTPEYRTAKNALRRHFDAGNEVLSDAAKNYGVTASMAALIKEAHTGGRNRPLYSAVIEALHTDGKIADIEALKDSIKEVMTGQGKLAEIKDAVEKEREEWHSNREGSVNRALEAAITDISTKNPLFNTRSAEFIGLPEETQKMILEHKDHATKTAKHVLELAKDPEKLVQAAFQQQLSMQILNTANQNAGARIEQLSEEMKTGFESKDAEIAALKSKLSGYEKLTQSSPGGVGRASPVSTGEKRVIITDPSRLAQTFR